MNYGLSRDRAYLQTVSKWFGITQLYSTLSQLFSVIWSGMAKEETIFLWEMHTGNITCPRIKCVAAMEAGLESPRFCFKVAWFTSLVAMKQYWHEIIWKEWGTIYAPDVTLVEKRQRKPTISFYIVSVRLDKENLHQPKVNQVGDAR